MNAITIKLPPEMLKELRAEAKVLGLSVASIIRMRLELVSGNRVRPTVYDLTSDLLGAGAGDGRSATNDRPKFRRR